MLNVLRMTNTLAVLGLEGESKCMLKSLSIRSLLQQRLQYLRKSGNSAMNTVSQLMFAGGWTVQADQMYMIRNSEYDFNQF